MQYSVATKVHMGWNASWDFTAPIGLASLKSQYCAYAQSQQGISMRHPGEETSSSLAHISTCPFKHVYHVHHHHLLHGNWNPWTKGREEAYGGCLLSRLSNEHEKLRQAFSEANLWLSGQHGLLPMTTRFLHQQVTEIRWGQRECMYQPNETRPSSLSTVSFSFSWHLPVLSLGAWGGSNPLKNRTQMYSKATPGWQLWCFLDSQGIL